MDERVQTVVDLVLKREKLIAERARLTVGLDRAITEIEAELLRLTGDGAGGPVAGAGQAAGSNGGNGDTYAGKVHQLLLSSPGLDYATMVTKVYGEDCRRNRNRLRAALDWLRKQGKVRATDRARWEAVTTSTDRAT